MKLKKWIFKVGIVLIAVPFLCLIAAQLKAKDEVRDFLNRKLPSHLAVNYKDMSVNILTGTLKLKDLSVSLSNRDSMLEHTLVTAHKFVLRGLGYKDFYLNNTISATNIIVDQPVVAYYKHKKTAPKDTVQQGVVNLLKIIKVGLIKIQNGKLRIYNDAADSVIVRADNINFSLANGRTDPDIIMNQIPLTYDQYTFSTDSSYIHLGTYEDMRLGPLTVSENHIEIKDVLLRSTYDKREMASISGKERDHIKLQIPQILLNEIDFGFKSRRFYVAADSINILQPNLELYRDKTLVDELRQRRLYSQMLRELPVDITIPFLHLEQGQMFYEERVRRTGTAGSLFFTDLDATITGLNNAETYQKDTKVKIQTNVMGEAKMDFTYDFKIHDPSDTFIATGALQNLATKQMNSFLLPNLNIETEGYIHQLYFTIHGNAYRSAGDMKMNYENFKLDIMDKDGKGEKKILSAIGNLFINDGSNADAEGYRFGKIEVERQMHKSFFNYMWKNMKDGIVSTLTGDGEKD